jgi:hypothetical protein
MVKTRSFVPLLAAAMLLVSSVAFANHTVRQVRIAVLDPRTGAQLSVLAPDQELTMSPGQEVMLRLVDPYPGPGYRGPVALPGTFGFGPVQSEIEVVQAWPSRGEAIVRLRPDAMNNRLHVGYKLDSRILVADEGLRLGRLLVRPRIVIERPLTDTPVPYGYGNSSVVDQMVDELYRGILMREPDAGGAASARQAILSGGYGAVERLAAGLAQSRESRVDVYSNGVSNEDRLQSLYAHLLGQSPDDVSSYAWRSDLQRLDRGGIADVVLDLIRTSEFENRFGVTSSYRR